MPDLPLFELPFIPRPVKNPPSSAGIAAIATTVLNAGGLLWVTATLAAADIIAANTAPGKVIIPAPGAGKIVFPVTALLTMHRPAGFSLSPSWTLRYAGFATTLISFGAPVQTTVDANAVLSSLSSGAVNIVKSVNDYSNQAVCLAGNQPTLANGAGSAYTIAIGYQLVTLP